MAVWNLSPACFAFDREKMIVMYNSQSRLLYLRNVLSVRLVRKIKKRRIRGQRPATDGSLRRHIIPR
jgi:hypothetical protein